MRRGWISGCAALVAARSSTCRWRNTRSFRLASSTTTSWRVTRVCFRSALDMMLTRSVPTPPLPRLLPAWRWACGDEGSTRGSALRLQVEERAWPLQLDAAVGQPADAPLTFCAADGQHLPRGHGRHWRHALRLGRWHQSRRVAWAALRLRSRRFLLTRRAGTPGGPFIEGINEGVLGMQVGGQRKLIVPPELACVRSASLR